MEAVERLQTCTSHSNSNNKNCLLFLSEILPPSYSDTLMQKCLYYYEKVFGQHEMWSFLEILKITNQEKKSKHRTFHSIAYNSHIYVGELDAKGILYIIMLINMSDINKGTSLLNEIYRNFNLIYVLRSSTWIRKMSLF